MSFIVKFGKNAVKVEKGSQPEQAKKLTAVFDKVIANASVGRSENIEGSLFTKYDYRVLGVNKVGSSMDCCIEIGALVLATLKYR